MQAIILAGGSGATLRPLTQRNPRSLVPLVNRPLIAHQIDLLASCGVTDVVVCVDALAERFERYFGEAAEGFREQGVRVRLHCDETPRGTAGAVKSAEPLLNSSLDRGLGGGEPDVLVLNGDILFDISVADLVAFHRKRGATATLCLSPNSDPSRYGVVLTDSSGRVQQFIEKPGLSDETPTDTINGGIYVFDRSVFHDIPADAPTYSLERSVFPALLRDGAAVYGSVSTGYWQDIATLTDYRKAQEDLLSGRVQGRTPGGQREGEQFWVGRGSSIHPTAEIIGPVALGKNVTVGRNVRIRGPVSIGSGCRIDDDAVIDRSILWRGSVVERGAIVRGCILADDCTVKEGAAVQEGSVLGDGAVVASYLASFAQAEQAAKKDKIRFGTDGWRGIIADDFTGENVRLVTQSVMDAFREPTAPGEPIVVIGYDNRSQSDYFAGEVAKIVTASGFKAILSNAPCSSPAVSYLTKYLRAKGGIMITASHNPPAFNGLKIKAYYGGSASPAIVGRVESHLHRLIDISAAPEAASVSDTEAVEQRDLSGLYLSHCASLVDLEAIRGAGRKIVVDAMYGSGAGYLPRVLAGAGIVDFVEIRNERNPIFGGISPEPTPQNMDALSRAVLEHGAAIGIALDGDADRVGAMDSRGKFVDSHRIFAVLLMHLVKRRHLTGGVVKTVSTTKMIDKLCAEYGLTLHETPIGFKHICDLMLREDILIGGEESGGIGVKNHLPERDGVLMGLLLLEAMAMSGGKTLDELVEEVFAVTGRREYRRLDLHPRAARMHTIISALQSYNPVEIAGRKVAETSRKDGTKFTFDDEAESWLMLRPSGTEPVVRIYAEGTDLGEVDELIAAGTKVVEDA